MTGFSFLANASLPAATRAPVTQDNSIILLDSESGLNHGKKPMIRIKGNQHIVALGFDAELLKGKKVAKATLVCRKGSQDIGGVTISTIQAPWDELKSNARTSGMQSDSGWGWPGSRFPAVCGGHSGSLVCQAPSTVVDGWYHWNVEPDLVHAIAIGAAYGLAVHEWSGDHGRNPTIYARESDPVVEKIDDTSRLKIRDKSKDKDKGKEAPKVVKNAPHLLLEFGGEELEAQPPTRLKLRNAGPGEGMLLLFDAPAAGFAYFIKVNGVELPRWNIPFVQPGEAPVIPLRDIDLDTGPVRVEVRTVDRLGREGPRTLVSGTRRQQGRMPSVRQPSPGIPGKPPDGMSVRPSLERVARSGRPVGRFNPDPSIPNEVWDGRSIRLSAARGEVVGFQVGLRGSGIQAVKCRVGSFRTDVFRGVFVKAGTDAVPDPLLPAGAINLFPDKEIALWVDVYVPFDAPAGEVAGVFGSEDGRRIPIRLKVRPFALPRRASFLCEMNTYGMPDKVSEYYGLQEVAYDHRVHVNVLPYSQSTAKAGARKSNMDMIMGDGRRMDEARFNAVEPGAATTCWDDFVKVFGPHLSGSWFATGHRGPIPAPGFYLPFHESWPLNVRAFWNGNMDAYEGFKDKPEYAATYEALVRDFLRIAEREGWKDAGFQVYLNNKARKGDESKNPWVLDEPAAYWDYRALDYFRDLTAKGRGDSPPARLAYRIDISRPQFTRGQLADRIDLWVVSSSAFRKYPRILADRFVRTGEEFWVYGTTSKPEHSARETQAWVLDAYRGGAGGVVPWQTVDKKGISFEEANPLGLFIFDQPLVGKGGALIRHSVRLKAYRRAQQDIEYLELLRKAYGLTRAQVRAFMDGYLPLKGQVVKTGESDAGTTRYGRLSPYAFYRLREAAARLIEAKR